jgi:phosphoserine phosphatase
MPICVFDLDRTLYDVDAIKRLAFRHVADCGITATIYEAAYRQTADAGFSFEGWLAACNLSHADRERLLPILYRYIDDGKPFLLPGVEEGLRRLRAQTDCQILTYGFPTFQNRKLAGLADVNALFSTRTCVWQTQTKGDILRDYPQSEVIFLDDAARFLLDVQVKAPAVRCVRMANAHVPAHAIPEDGTRWPVVTSFAAFEELVAPWLGGK